MSATPDPAYQWQKLSVSWTNLANRTNATLVLTNVQPRDDADYRVVVTNTAGATNSTPAHLYVLVPPKITPTVNFQHQAVHIGSNTLFAVTASGTPPLAYQWRLDGHELTGQTNSTINFNPAQPADEGDYTVVITNLAGAVTSEPARLWVVPPPTNFCRGDYTNGSFRYPYFYLMPTNYNPAHSYPLVFFFHCSEVDEIDFWKPIPGVAPAYPDIAATQVFVSYRQQATNPAIVVWPTVRAGDTPWRSDVRAAGDQSPGSPPLAV